MYVIQITGGREYTDGSAIYNTMKPYIEKYGAKNVLIRHGGARGADSLSHFQARRLGVPDDHIQARKPEYYGYSWDLDKEGNAAGNLRNIAMLEEEPKPDIVLAFPGGKGTANMIEFAKERQILIVIYNDEFSKDVILYGTEHIANTASNITADSIATDIEFGIAQELSAAMLFADEIWPGSLVHRLPEYSDLDYVITWRGEIKAFVEIKARRVDVATYKTTMIPLRKHIIAKSIYDSLKVPTFAIIVFQDAMVSFHLENAPDGIEYVKRDDRDKGMEHGFYDHIRFTFHIRKDIPN